jgi:hypothetical protein
MDNMYQWPDYIGSKGSIMVNGEPIEVRVQLNEEETEARIFIKSENFGDNYHSKNIPETVTVFDRLTGNELGDYTVSEVYLNCREWDIKLPKTVKEVVIHEGKKIGGVFFVDENNPYLFSNRGSLYSKDGKLIYLCINSVDNFATINLNDDVKMIMPEAIHSDKRLSLVIPKACRRWVKNAITGSFERIDFTGGLQAIESGVLNNYDFSCNDIRINGLLSDINNEGQNELYTWYKNRDDYRNTRRLFLAAPMAKDSEALENGYIKLTRVLSTQEKLERTLVDSMDKDACPVYINSYINERFSTKDNITIPIVIDTVPLYDGNYSGWNYYFYKPIEVTRIYFVDVNEGKKGDPKFFNVLVHEPVERVHELIHESFVKVKKQ